MRNRIRLVAMATLVVLIAFPGVGELKLTARKGADRPEPVRYTLNTRFSYENALGCIERIRGALSSFEKLTEKTKTSLSEKELREIGHTGWEMQNLGFPNAVGALEGTLRKQNYQIKKLEFELAKEHHAGGKITEKELERKHQAYEHAERSFQKFWDSFQIAD